jgi:SAM-dependent methyltransferase
MDPRKIVEAGYDRIAEHYLAQKEPDDPVTVAALERLAQSLPSKATVLDLGCGAGVPVTQWLAQRFKVTGVDVSTRQLELARQYVPNATFVKADMSTLDLPPETFDGIVAFYSIIHVPRAEQPDLVRRVYRWLRPGGEFLATWSLAAWEGDDQDWAGWGAPMWWSVHDPDTNLTMLREAGFVITEAEPRTSGDETWLWVEARKETEDERPGAARSRGVRGRMQTYPLVNQFDNGVSGR